MSPRKKPMNQLETRPTSREGLESYRAVEHALAIHGNVEATLDTLDGHHSQTHRNKVKQSCIGVRRDGGRQGRQRKTGVKIEDRMGRRGFPILLVETRQPSDLGCSAVCQP